LTAIRRGFAAWFNRGRLPILLAGIVALFALAGLAQVWRHWSLPPAYGWPAGDDYEWYHHMAVDVVERGLAMPAAPVPYSLPACRAGFLYIYFVALCYRVLGVHPPAVFVVQSAMLGGSVALLFLTFRRELGQPAQALLLGSLGVFAFLDMERQYAIQLFSENLVIFELAGFFYLTRLGFVDGRRWARIPALAVLGTIPLTRPNAVFFVPAALLWLIAFRRGRRFWRDLALGVVGLAAVLSAMAMRNHAAGGQWVAFPPVEWRALPVPGYDYRGPGAEVVVRQVDRPQGALPLVKLVLHAWSRDPAGVGREYARRILFVAGFVPLVQPKFRYRPHWMLLWVAFVAALAWRLVRGPRPGPMVQILLIWLAVFLGPLVAISSIANYGFRYVVPGVLPAVAGAVVLLAVPRGPGLGARSEAL
jgi:Dolichyl-phosphate-mannose-protein mannosyltransferase